MNVKSLIIAVFVVNLSAFGQTNDALNQQLEQKGLRLLNDYQLSKQEVQELLLFNFEPYRDRDQGTIVKVKNGPTLEVFSKSKQLTGEDKIIEHDHEHGHDSDFHVHIPADQKEIKRLKVYSVKVFTTTTE